MEGKPVRLSKKSLLLLNSYREHSRETWNDLFEKMVKKMKGGTKK